MEGRRSGVSDLEGAGGQRRSGVFGADFYVRASRRFKAPAGHAPFSRELSLEVMGKVWASSPGIAAVGIDEGMVGVTVGVVASPRSTALGGHEAGGSDGVLGVHRICVGSL